MYKLYLGDSLSGLKQIDNDTFDLILADPPYFDYWTNFRKDKNSKLSKGIVQQDQEDQLQTLQECIRVLKPSCPFFFFTNWENTDWMMRPFKGLIRNMIIWDKGNWTAGSLKDSFGNKYEVILFGVKGKGWEIRGPRLPDIWEIPRKGTKRVHPTEKPVELYRRCIEIAVPPGSWICDPYGGSGASLQAALELNCHIVAWEIDEHYYRVIDERLRGLV